MGDMDKSFSLLKQNEGESGWKIISQQERITKKDFGFFEHREMVLGIGAFLMGWFRYEVGLPFYDPGDLAYYHDESKSVVLEGIVVNYPDVRADQTKLTIKIDQLIRDKEVIEVSGMVLATVDRYPEYFYGDRLRITGTIKEPVEFDEFSYKRYLQRYGIHSVMYYPRIKIVEKEAVKDWKFYVFGFKAAIEDRFNQLMPEPQASFAAGLLLGSRKGIPAELMQDFNTSGLTHIIAISGYNITLIIVFVSGMLRFLAKRWQTIIASIVIIVFVVLVGGTAAVVRSAIMGVLSLWAIWFGRQAQVTRLLAITAGMMVMWNPFILVDDVGFQLSFAATCGLIYMSSFVENVLKKLKIYGYLPEIFSIREALLTTLSAQTLAVPVIISAFGRFSLIAPLANVAAVSFIPLAMLFSALALLGSYFWMGGGYMIAYVAWFFMELILQIAHWCAAIPGASIDF